MEYMRTDYSIKNSSIAMATSIISYVIAFISQAIFIRILGVEYLGLNGLFTNVLTMLSIFELGIGNAIVFNLYKPIAQNDTNKISALMNFYRKAYRLIAIIILFLGIMLLPFLKYIVGNVAIDINIYIVYMLFLSGTVISYFMSYKRNLIIAMQRNYVISIIHTVYLVILNVCQLAIIFFTENYYLYLIVKIICQLLENIVITNKTNRDYPYLKDKDNNTLDKETEKDIFSRVKALILHKIGNIMVNGTDNIIISSFFGLKAVGMYSNYYTIISAISTLLGQTITSVTASVGNLIATENAEKRYLVFKRIRFFNFWIDVFAGISILIIMQPFIVIWVGEEYILSTFILITLVFNFYQKNTRSCYNVFKDSAGIWREDKFVPLIETGLNIIFSIIFLKIFGLAGVFIGTITSGLILWCYSYPKFVYKKIFERSYINYAKETIGYMMIFLIIAILTYSVSRLFIVENVLLQIIINIVICLVVPNFILYILFRKTGNFRYFLELVKKVLKKITNKDN